MTWTDTTRTGAFRSRSLRAELLDEAKPHWGIAASLAAAAVSTYASQNAAAKQRKAVRNASALSNLPGGASGSSPFSATALSQKAKMKDKFDELGIKDLLQTENPSSPTPLYGGSDIQHETSLFRGDEFSGAGKAPPPGATERDFHLFSGDEIRADLTAQSMGQPPPVDQQQNQPPPSTTGLQTNDYLSLASTLGGLASTFAKGNGPPAGGGIPQPGQMNFQPTALAQLARRRGY